MRASFTPAAAVFAALALAGGLFAARPDGVVPIAAQTGDAGATATRTFEEVQLADLQTQVADLSTRVAELGGADLAQVAARLGGSRTSFDAAFGLPVAYVGVDSVQYDVSDVGRVIVTFLDGVAQRVVVVAPRPVDKPLDQPDEADWTPQKALEIADRFAPTDAGMPTDVAQIDIAQPVAGTSEALNQAIAEPDAQGCTPVGPRGFTLVFVSAAADKISAIDLAIAPESAALAPTTPSAGGRSNRGAGAVANSSIGGTVSVNGVKVQALQTRENVKGARPAAEGASLFAVELTVENGARKPVSFALSDFILTDAQGQEVTAICGGVDPAFTQADIAGGESVDGWVTFQIPDGFVPERVVVLAPNARVSFTL
ncbi:MAG: DUF4352 domain-containing protein [Thermomicrobiales bacterium]|nr:DUF4352 domain-containing protein [Thermomicrobiales bacterium]